ncbi:Uncharacterised protein [Aggregatibacter aphrophilus]|uniref:Uncharacterized protein n=1 Tax=Aggregatibacter aphrophilus TaxID=732 RepID=A0A336N2Q2_AGGAP|nr:Uncharacterised protein [Aggregatibacter aphrophilus]
MAKLEIKISQKNLVIFTRRIILLLLPKKASLSPYWGQAAVAKPRC